jgi:hypothetical protein
MRRFILPLVAGILMPAGAFAQSETPAVSTSTASMMKTDHRALLDELNAKISEMEAKIVRTSEGVNVLKDAVLEGIVARARGKIVHVNQMRGKFNLAKATYTLDGGIIYDKDDVDGSLSNQEEVVLFDGPITPGEHEIKVSLLFKVGSVGPFTYAEGYKFKVESRYVLKTIDNRYNELRIVSHDKGEADVSKQTSDRIGVRYDFEAKVTYDTPKPPPAQPDSAN